VAVTAAGSGKILFGSDFPLIPPRRYFKEVTSSGLSREDIARICGDNAAALLGISQDFQ
jgi:hypothetical protein